MTNNWVDIKNADVVLVMGGNPAEAHPCGFKWVVEAKAHNKAKLVVVDPRFTRTAAVADVFAQIRPGADIAFLGGVINYLLSNDKIQHEYVKAYTNAPFMVRADYQFEGGLFSGYDAAVRSYDPGSWSFRTDANGNVLKDPALSDARSVWRLLAGGLPCASTSPVAAATAASKATVIPGRMALMMTRRAGAGSAG